MSGGSDRDDKEAKAWISHQCLEPEDDDVDYQQLLTNYLPTTVLAPGHGHYVNSLKAFSF